MLFRDAKQAAACHFLSWPLVMATALLLFPVATRAQFTFASDDAANYGGAGEPGWTNTSDGGSGFGTWGLTTTTTNGGTAGFFLGSSSSQGFGDINTGGQAFAMFANPSGGNLAKAGRGFEDGALGAGDVFAIELATAFRNGSKGIDLFVGATKIWTFNVGGDQYTAGGIDLGWSYSQTSIFNLEVTQNSSSSISIRVVRGGDTFTTNVAVSGGLSAFDLYVANTDAGNDLNNFYFNSLSVTNSGIFTNGGTVTNARAFTGAGALSIGGNTTLTLSSAGNTFGGGLTISNGSILRAASVGSGAISLGGTLASDGATARTFTNTVTVTTNVTLGEASVGTGDLTFSGAFVLGSSGRSVTVNNAISTISGALTGSGGLTKAGNGILVLANNNTNSYTGATTLSAGTLRVGNNGALGTNGLILNGGTLASDSSTARTLSNNVTLGGNVTLGDATGTGALTLAGTVNLGTATNTVTVANNTTFSGAVTNSGGLTKDGAGTLTMDGTQTYAGATVVAAGVLNYLGSNNATAQTVVSNGASLFLGNGGTAGWVAGTISNNGTLVYNRSDNITQAGLISGTGQVSKEGAGTLTLSSANTYSGATTVSTGTVVAASDSALGTSAGSTTVSNGASLELSGGITSAENITITGEGVNGVGAIRSLGNGENTLTGTITLGGNARINVDAPSGSVVTLASFGTDGFMVDGDLTNITNTPTATNLTLTSAAIEQYLAGEFVSAPRDWSTVSTFGLRSTAPTNPNIGFRVSFYDADALNPLRTYEGETAGLTNTPSIAILDLAAGSGSLADVTYLDFEWLGGAASVNFSMIDLVSIPTSGMAISNISGGANVLTLDVAAGGTNTVATGLLVSGVISGAGNTFSNTTTSLVLDGGGVVELTGNNTFTGDIRVLDGTLRVGAGASTNALGVNADLFLSPGAELVVADDVSVGSVEVGSGSIKLLESSLANVGSVLTINGGGKTNTVSGDISGFGGLTLAGNSATRLELTGDNTYSKATTITGGTLVANATDGKQALGLTASINVQGGSSTLLLLSSDQVRDNASVTLSGGTIQRGSGVSEVFGNLNLTTASFLDFGTGAAGNLSFGTYAPSSLLTIQNFDFGSTLTFKSDLSTFVNDPSVFAFEDGGISSYSWDGDTFTITAIPEPSTYAAAAGLAAMLLWSLRRRWRKGPADRA